MSFKTKKVYVVIFIFIMTLPFFNSCQKSDDELIGNWVELSSFDGLPRGDAVGFSIGTSGYIGTGYDEDGDRLNDLWEYNSALNYWTQKADFPGVPRNSAIGFSTDTKGYIGTGFDGKNKLNDFWEYDPVTNIWTQKADFAGSPRYSAVAMSINNKGYVSTGYDGNYLKDFWEYDPETDSWSQKISMGGKKRKDAATFVIDGKGYLLTGIDNGTYIDDLWEYDPATESWSEKRSIANVSDEEYDNDYKTITGVGKVGFSFNGKGYLATGGKTIGVEVWEYDPVSDLWNERTSFEGTSRSYAVGFSIGNLGYVTAGRSGGYYFDDIWSFSPNAEYDENDK